MTTSVELPATTVNDLPVNNNNNTDDAADASPTKSVAGKWDIWWLGISIGLGGQYFSWNAGLHAGLYTFFIDFVVVGTAYFALCCCTSEIAGALPFAGGAYGLSRCTLGYYPGFLIGCAEACEYIAYVSTAVMSLAKMLVECVPELAGYEPLIWMVVYSHACYVHYRGDRFFWRWNFVLGTTSFIILLIYIGGSIPHVDFAANADTDPEYRYINGISGFLKSLPLACLFFVGVEALNLASDDVVDAAHAIPFAQLSCITTLLVLGTIVFFVTVSLPPPGLTQVAKLLAPFDNGFHVMFGIPLDLSTLFSIPAMYATTFGFMWGYGKLISAMATSKLLPLSLAQTSDKYDTPINAVLFGSSLSYCLCLVVYYVPYNIDEYVYNVCIAAGFLGYAGQCVGYISMKRFYPGLSESTFKSPFGIYGAIYSLTVWVLGLISVALFQDRYTIEFGAFGICVALLSLFYVLYAKKHQTFSAQESKVFFMAHVMKFNREKQSKRQLVEKNPPRRRLRHIHPKHTPVVHAEPVDGLDTSETRPGTPAGRRGSGGSAGGAAGGGSTKNLTPLALPVAKWMPFATPFYRYFSNPTLVEAEYKRSVASAAFKRRSISEMEATVAPMVNDFSSMAGILTTTRIAASSTTTPMPAMALAALQRKMFAFVVDTDDTISDTGSGDATLDDDDVARESGSLSRPRKRNDSTVLPGRTRDLDSHRSLPPLPTETPDVPVATKATGTVTATARATATVTVAVTATPEAVHDNETKNGS